ncbi:MAG TPA: malate synthase A [Rickettsiales bacterium]|nr:malate synthase A [Rickettsiales bacterium]
MSQSTAKNLANAYPVPAGMTIKGAYVPGGETVFTAEALAFVAEIARKFSARRDALLAARAEVQSRLDKGELLDFLPETKNIRESDWGIAGIPKDLQDRRVEITGPVERKMVINALNSGAKVFMADFEDSLSPVWEAVVQGQINMRDAVSRTIRYVSPEGKQYQLNEKTAVLIVRPRGWHLNEKHVLVDGKEIPGAFLDFGIYFYNNAKALLANDSGPYFYLPKTEHYKEAELWRDIFQFAEETLELKRGTIKATLLIETINATFQMDEIIHALKDYCVALNCGRWDYIFSFIKKFHARPDFMLPERAQVTMTTHFLRSYSQLLIKTTHRRGAMAMGGMAAFIPVKNDEAANDKAIAAVRADKEREAGDGHDGTWVAHPGLVPVAMDVFNRIMPQPNQIDRKREDVNVTAKDLLAIPEGTITEAGLRGNISVGLQYIAAWIGGNGCVPINNLMEDAATAEISRSQIWQWVHHKAKLDDGRQVTYDLFRQLLPQEIATIREKLGDQFDDSLFARAAKLLEKLVKQEEFTEFLTLPGYELLQ